MGRELWPYAAQLWPYVAEGDYRRERIAADFARVRRGPGAHPPALRGRLGLRRRFHSRRDGAWCSA